MLIIALLEVVGESRQRSSNRQEDLEITHFYNRPELLSVSDQHYCARPLSQQILKFTPTNRRRWLRQVKMARSNNWITVASHNMHSPPSIALEAGTRRL